MCNLYTVTLAASRANTIAHSLSFSNCDLRYSILLAFLDEKADDTHLSRLFSVIVVSCTKRKKIRIVMNVRGSTLLFAISAVVFSPYQPFVRASLVDKTLTFLRIKKNDYTPLLYFTVPKGEFDSCEYIVRSALQRDMLVVLLISFLKYFLVAGDEMNKMVTQVEKELGSCF